MKRHLPPAVLAVFLTVAPGAALSQSMDQGTVQENKSQVQTLNAFADDLLDIVAHWERTGVVETSARIGGYARMPEYFREVEYAHAERGDLSARIRWVRERPDQAQMIEVFLRDGEGRLLADYFVSYLVDHRNAPMYALINLHSADGGLRAFRQFDVFGEQLFERCEGEFESQKVDLSIDAFDPTFSRDGLPAGLYEACFGGLPSSPGPFADPAELVPGLAGTDEARDGGAAADPKTRIAELDRLIAATPNDAALHLARGKANLLLGHAERAVADFTRALDLNAELDAAYFGRGMALGRLGRLEEGIADLTHFIDRNPESSLGYTKRGVRKIWNKDFEGAVRDLKMAVFLDDGNAEAHDDLGVALAQTDRLAEAIEHFIKARSIDPSYRKAHHNLAMVLYMVGDLENALGAVDDALRLDPDIKNTLLLKGTILDGMGRVEEARDARRRAESLTDGHWSERSAIQ